MPPLGGDGGSSPIFLTQLGLAKLPTSMQEIQQLQGLCKSPEAVASLGPGPVYESRVLEL